MKTLPLQTLGQNGEGRFHRGQSSRHVRKEEIIMRYAPACLILVLLAPLAALHAADLLRPNLVIINIDDLGYGDIGPFGSTLNRTPNLDRIAAEGRLTSFYAAPVCSPSRAALMTDRSG